MLCNLTSSGNILISESDDLAFITLEHIRYLKHSKKKMIITYYFRCIQMHLHLNAGKVIIILHFFLYTNRSQKDPELLILQFGEQLLGGFFSYLMLMSKI